MSNLYGGMIRVSIPVSIAAMVKQDLLIQQTFRVKLMQYYARLKVLIVALAIGGLTAANAEEGDYLFHDSHFHLTNYVQEGTDIRDYLAIMDGTVGRSTLFGIPLQQTWSFANTGKFAPTYYLHSDSPLYYYSFTDASIAQAYNSLNDEEKARFDPMITGFNPADMYAADHIKRVLLTFPGVFSGIGEFSIHKEFVSSKIAGDTPSLNNPALDRILKFAGEVGLAVILHCDIDIPFQKEGVAPTYNDDLGALARRHPDTTIIWAHIGLGRVIFPPRIARAKVRSAERSPLYIEMVEETLQDASLDHVLYDISWDELAKFIVGQPEATEEMARVINAYPDRFLFGTDVVAPRDRDHYLGVYHTYAPLWEKLNNDARHKVLKTNYERVFDKAASRVRAWEAEHANK